jgi:hypothetical protein
MEWSMDGYIKLHVSEIDEDRDSITVGSANNVYFCLEVYKGDTIPTCIGIADSIIKYYGDKWMDENPNDKIYEDVELDVDSFLKDLKDLSKNTDSGKIISIKDKPKK